MLPLINDRDLIIVAILFPGTKGIEEEPKMPVLVVCSSVSAITVTSLEVFLYSDRLSIIY